MRPSSWWNWGLKNANIVLQISVHNLLASNISIIQLVPFSLLSWFRSVHFVHYKYKMRGKSTWNIWMRIKWEGNLSEIFGRRYLQLLVLWKLNPEKSGELKRRKRHLVNGCNVTLHLLRNIFKRTVEKSQTNATNVTLPLLGQTFWRHIRKHTVEKIK